MFPINQGDLGLFKKKKKNQLLSGTFVSLLKGFFSLSAKTSAFPKDH